LVCHHHAELEYWLVVVTLTWAYCLQHTGSCLAAGRCCRLRDPQATVVKLPLLACAAVVSSLSPHMYLVLHKRPLIVGAVCHGQSAVACEQQADRRQPITINISQRYAGSLPCFRPSLYSPSYV
jgi:hypothetical protein